MRDKYIKDYEKDEEISEFFLVTESGSIKETKQGKPYGSLRAKDKTRDFECKCWSENLSKIGENIIKSFNPGDVIKVKGIVDFYKDNPQIVFTQIRLATENDIYDNSDFYKVAPIESIIMYNKIMNIIDIEIEDEEYRKVCKKIYDDHKQRLLYWPAAKLNHHACEGGLLWHTYRMTQIALNLVKIYPHINKSLLLSGVILHDIGKISEFSYDNHIIDYTFSGNTLGHTLIGTMLVNNVANDQKLPKEKKFLLEHMIASHHGNLEWGAIKEPRIMEAILLHEIDMIDSQITKIEEQFEEIENGNTIDIKIGKEYRSFYKPTNYINEVIYNI